MGRTVSIGSQDFATLRENHYFLVDKTLFIREWWESADCVTLITRPRRFGKTLNMRMLECFFSNQYKDRPDLFEDLAIWQEEKYRNLQGTFPVLLFSFAGMKADELEGAKKQVKQMIAGLYEEHRYLLSGSLLSENEKSSFARISDQMDDIDAATAIQKLCGYLYRYYGKKVILLLDEYDTPVQEAYLNGYWDFFTSYIRNFFNATFKTNPYMERALLTGITRISKESIFSDLNNLNVVTTTSTEYERAFGFTEQEVADALAEMGLSAQMEQVKKWYDGFTFGQVRDIYTPWSITNFLDKKQFRPYWAATSSNGLVNQLIRTGSGSIKRQMECLISGESITVSFDEQIVYNQLEKDERAVWSLLLASGYLKVDEVEYRSELLEPWYHLRITNLETFSMFCTMFQGWFGTTLESYNEFLAALLCDDRKAMNAYMNDVALMTFGQFDTGKHPSGKSQPERFYHGFVLGLLVDLRDRYSIQSNGESGYGRYDIMMVPKEEKDPAIVIEFKVQDPEEEEKLEDTVQAALRQIADRKYDAKLLSMGISEKRTRHYGFAFAGKKVLIG